MRVCFIQYQGHMLSGGQGVYLHYVSRELARMGHDVHVIAGVPYPTVSDEVQLHKLKNFSFWSYLDNFDEYAYHTHPLLYFHPVNLFEFATTRYTLSSLLNMFSLRAYHKLNELERERPFDLIHDNQTLGYGIWLMKQRGRHVVANIHHPLAIDRHNALAQARSVGAKISRILWYPWVMQQWVAERVDRIITGSDASADSIVQSLGMKRDHIRVIHDGVESEVFRPLDDVQRQPDRILFVGNSEDRNKGILYLLRALRQLRGQVPFHLRVIHHPGSKGAPATGAGARPAGPRVVPGVALDRGPGRPVQQGAAARLAVALRRLRPSRGRGARLRHTSDRYDRRRAQRDRRGPRHGPPRAARPGRAARRRDSFAAGRSGALPRHGRCGRAPHPRAIQLAAHRGRDVRVVRGSARQPESASHVRPRPSGGAMKVCFLLHQGSMYSGGQGIYLHHVTRELAALGNEVHVIAGPPYPELADDVVLHKVQSYSVYRLLETARIFFYGREPLSFFKPLNFYEMATSRFGHVLRDGRVQHSRLPEARRAGG